MPRFAFDHIPQGDDLSRPAPDAPAPVCLDRNAPLRGAPARLAAALTVARVVPLWRGRVMFDAVGAPANFPADHPIFAQGEPPVYLGQSGPKSAPQH